MHYLNHTLPMLASFGDKILAQLTVSTFSKKGHLELSISKSVMLNPLLCFITENYLIINKYINNKLPSIFTNWFTFSSMSHNNQISFASKRNLQIPSIQTTSYGKNAFVYMVIRTWNDIQKEIKGVMLNTLLLAKLKSLLIEFYLNMYKRS